MLIQPIVNFTAPDGALRSLFVGDVSTIEAAHAGIASAIEEARQAGGKDIQLRLVSAAGNTLRAFRIPFTGAR